MLLHGIKLPQLYMVYSKKQAMGKSLFELIPSLEEDKETFNAIKQALNGHKSFVPASKIIYTQATQRKSFYTFK